MELFLGYLFIFTARVIDVSMATIRMLLIVRGKKYYAAIIGFFEVSIFITALGKVMNNFDDIWNVLAYASGFATGNIVGSFIEGKMALGTITLRVIPKSVCDTEMADRLRKLGFGVTVIDGMGKDGPICILEIALHRKELPKLIKYLDEIDSRAFVTISDARATRGGYLRRVKKNKS